MLPVWVFWNSELLFFVRNMPNKYVFHWITPALERIIRYHLLEYCSNKLVYIHPPPPSQCIRVFICFFKSCNLNTLKIIRNYINVIKSIQSIIYSLPWFCNIDFKIIFSTFNYKTFKRFALTESTQYCDWVRPSKEVAEIVVSHSQREATKS